MESFEFLIERIALKIKKTEELRRKIGERIRGMKLIKKIEPQTLNLKVAAVDGGVERKSLRSFDLLLLKSVGVIYSYENDKLKSVNYYPEALPKPEPIVLAKAYSEIELDLFVNIQRQKMEVETASEVIKEFRPKMMLLDGSVIPHYSYVQSKDSPLYSAYEEMIKSYKKLFSTATHSKCLLVGVIKDSRGSRFCESISSHFSGEEKILLEDSKDVAVLDYALKKCERTVAFDYTENPERHPVLKEFPKIEVKSFYFKPSEFDTPVRIDLLGNNVEEIAGLLCGLIPSESYAVPAILIEADQRARIVKEEMFKFYSDLLSRLGPLASLKEIRRDRRPW